MAFELVLERERGPGEKHVGEDVYLADLPGEFPCYALFYPGQMPEPTLEKALRKLGQETGGNLFVNLGSFRDPQYRKIATLFEIQRHPAIILTAIAPLASPENDFLSSYVRLDHPKLLASPERTIKCVQEVFNLFHRGEIAKAIKKGKSAQRAELLRAVGDCVRNALGFLWDFISVRDISISLAEGRFELKRSGS